MIHIKACCVIKSTVPICVNMFYMKPILHAEKPLFLFQVTRDSCPTVNYSNSSTLCSRTQPKLKISSEDIAEKILSTSYDHRTIPHLDDSTIGKHGGELLFYH